MSAAPSSAPNLMDARQRAWPRYVALGAVALDALRAKGCKF